MRQTRFSPGWGEVVRRLREARGWSQEDLAVRAGVDQSRVSKIESGGQTDARLSTVTGLAEALGVPIDFLIGRDAPALALADQLDAVAVELRASQQAAELERERLATRKRDSRNLKASPRSIGETTFAGVMAS